MSQFFFNMAGDLRARGIVLEWASALSMIEQQVLYILYSKYCTDMGLINREGIYTVGMVCVRNLALKESAKNSGLQ
jgi:hypothetical protein